jgi:hypothetical protein
MSETVPVSRAIDGPRGIGGWLVLPAIGLTISPFFQLFGLLTDVLPAFEKPTWEALTIPGGELYHPSTAALLSFEVAANICLIVFSVYLIYLFWNKSRQTPDLMVMWIAATALVIAIDTLWSMQIPFIADNMDPSFFKDMIRSLVAAAIWIPYFMFSKRVKNTFVH